MPLPHHALGPVVRRLRAAGCVFAEEEADLLLAEARTPDGLESLVSRRVAGEPLEHLLGWVEFCGLRLLVDPGVFVPRQRTALLVRQAETEAAAHEHPVVVDLCCGCGAMAVVLAERLPGVEVHAADLDPVAVANARRNLEHRGGQVHAGDLYDALPQEICGRVDVLVVNAPYVPTGAIAMMPPEARDHEPSTALDGGADGLDVHRRVAQGAPEWLSRGGMLLVEVSTRQAPVAAELLKGYGLEPRIVRSEEHHATVVTGRSRRRGPPER
ncbi:MAG: putative protein N(5)-glutamine methyltransferase [Marmoricola sp.]